LPARMHPLIAPRVGVYKPYGDNTDEGWTRWVLEQYEFPFSSISTPEMRTGMLRGRFDAIILPNVPAAALGSGTPLPMTTNSTVTRSAWNGFALCNTPATTGQVYIGGFSGGARVALRLALGYPDLFHGALLNAGSDPIGTADVPLPPADLFKRFQESTRIVYLTGERDEENLAIDMGSRRSLEKWCVLDVVTRTEPRTGHQLADGFSLGRALEALLGGRQVPSEKLDACRDRLAKLHPM